MNRKNIFKYIYKYKKEVKFMCAGTFTTSIDLVVYIFLSRNLDITISKLISTMVACITSLVINKNWTFEYNNKFDIVLVLKYFISQIINITLNVVTNTIIYKLTNIKLLAFVLATVIAMMLNFLMQKLFVFKK